MKVIKEWLERINTDENFSKKFENLNDVKEVVELAEKEGYKITEDELMDLQIDMVSGGGLYRNLLDKGKNAKQQAADAAKNAWDFLY